MRLPAGRFTTLGWHVTSDTATEACEDVLAAFDDLEHPLRARRRRVA